MRPGRAVPLGQLEASPSHSLLDAGAKRGAVRGGSGHTAIFSPWQDPSARQTQEAGRVREGVMFTRAGWHVWCRGTHRHTRQRGRGLPRDRWRFQTHPNRVGRGKGVCRQEPPVWGYRSWAIPITSAGAVPDPWRGGAHAPAPGGRFQRCPSSPLTDPQSPSPTSRQRSPRRPPSTTVTPRTQAPALIPCPPPPESP